MFQEEVSLTCGEGRYKIFLTAVMTLDGISVIVTGGERPHMGGSALSVPRPRPAQTRVKCDTWITPRPGHKDSDLAAQVAQKICTETGQATAVIVGIHLGAAQKHEIKQLVDNSLEAAGLLIKNFKEIVD